MPYEVARAAAVNRLLVEVGRLTPVASDCRPEQHVVSQVLLKRFTVPMKGGARLYPFDLEHPEVLRDLLAVHLARSYTYRDLHRRTFPTSYASTFRSLTEERGPEVREAVLREKGLHIVGRGGLEYYAGKFLEPSVDLFESGALLRVRIEELYAQIRERIASSGVRVYTPRGSGEFLMGDVPAFTFRRGPGRPLVGVALDVATTVVLPIGPKHLLALAQQDELVPASPAMVTWANVMQVMRARRKVFLRPDSGLDVLVREVCNHRQTCTAR